MKITKYFIVIFYIFCIFLLTPLFTNAEGLESSLKGRIILQVEENGEAWYVNPADEKLYYLGRPADAFQIMQDLGLGISESDFFNLNLVGQGVPPRLAGRILLRIGYYGKAYYVNPIDSKMHYLGRPYDAFQVMRNLSLGISNNDFNEIDKSKLIKDVTKTPYDEHDKYLLLVREISDLLQMIYGYLIAHSNRDAEIIRNDVNSNISEVEEKLAVFPKLNIDIIKQYDDFVLELEEQKENLDKTIFIKANSGYAPIIEVDDSDWIEHQNVDKGFIISHPESWSCEDLSEEYFKCSNGLSGQEQVILEIYTITCLGCNNTTVSEIKDLDRSEVYIGGIKGTRDDWEKVNNFEYLESIFRQRIYTNKYKIAFEVRAKSDNSNIYVAEEIARTFKFID